MVLQQFCDFSKGIAFLLPGITGNKAQGRFQISLRRKSGGVPLHILVMDLIETHRNQIFYYLYLPLFMFVMWRRELTKDIGLHKN